MVLNIAQMGALSHNFLLRTDMVAAAIPTLDLYCNGANRISRLTIAAIMILYFIIGLEVFKLKGNLELLSNNHIPLSSSYNVESDKQHNSIANNTLDLTPEPRSVQAAQQKGTGFFSINRTPSFQPSPPTSLTLNLRKESPISFRHYILMPLIFFIVLLATWVPLTINRVYAFIDPGFVSYPLLLFVGAFGSLRGFWNGILFITIGMKGWNREKGWRKGCLLQMQMR